MTRRSFRVYPVIDSPFPFDMLRYDSCWPKSQNDVARLSAIDGVQRSVELETDERNAPTIERWESFSWRVVDDGVGL